MPSPKTLERFIAKVERNEHDTAIEEFYTENASMQENNAPPRTGKDTLVKNEREVMAKAKKITSECMRPVFVNGNHVVIRWKFRFNWKNDTTTEIEEIAYQEWDGELIAKEQFFYDPKQFSAK